MRIIITGGAGFVGAHLALSFKRDMPPHSYRARQSEATGQRPGAAAAGSTCAAARRRPMKPYALT
jgi:nucleoside-diphosphate-sugar epimerase